MHGYTLPAGLVVCVGGRLGDQVFVRYGQGPVMVNIQTPVIKR
jgi:hypothetical protein